MSVTDRGSEGGGTPPFDLQTAIFQPLREHRLFIFVFVISAMASALTLTYVYSERYRAETTIFFKSSDVRRLGNSSNSTLALGSPLPPTLPYKVITQTINSLAVSDQLLRQVVTNLNLDAPQPRDLSGPWYMYYYKMLKYWLSDTLGDLWKIVRFGRIIDQDPVNKAISDLRKEIRIRNDDSYIFTLRVTTKSPQRAVAIADEVSALLIDLVYSNEIVPAQEEIAKLARLRDGKFREIEGLENRLRDLLGGAETASIKEEIDKTTALSSQLKQERSNAVADLQQSDTKLRQLEGKLRLLAAPGTSLRGSRLSADDHAKLTTERHAAEIDTASLRARVASLDQSIAQVVQRLLILNRIQAQHELMLAQLSSAKRDYAALSDAYQELLIRTGSGQTELRILANATMPEVPVSPIKIYHTAAAGFVAALLAIGLAFVLDFFKIRVFLPPAGGRRRPGEPTPALAPDERSHAAAAD